MPVPANNRYLLLPSLHFCAVFALRVHGAAGAAEGERRVKVAESSKGEKEVRRERRERMELTSLEVYRDARDNATRSWMLQRKDQGRLFI